MREQYPQYSIKEIDEELTQHYGGTFPTDPELKTNVLAPQIIEDVLSRSDVIFFTNTDYFSIQDLRHAKEKGFTIVQLNIELQELFMRNTLRVKNEGYDDISQWLPGMCKYQKQIFDVGLVDYKIDATKSTTRIATEIVAANLNVKK